MTKTKANLDIERLEFPVTEDQDIPITFYFESPREEVEKVMTEHHARMIVKALKKYSMPQRKEIYEKLMQKLKDN
ncbi:MAG TPA: hypothetical protein GX707_20880 [Epulopiscium sp.]|nr:hypothetical protein [Candidatus Epulonipiscium sp.]